MAEVTAGAVKTLREKTGLPLMECKKALQDAGGNEEAAIKLLRESGKKTQETRLGRDTSEGRIAIYIDPNGKGGAIVELLCESAPVTKNDEFIALANDLAKQLATGPGAASAEELLQQKSPSKPSQTLGEVKDDLFNRIREVFNVGRILRFEGATGGYAHHDGTLGALIDISGGTPDLAKKVAMHIVAKSPISVSKEDLDPAAVEHEKAILMEAARKEGKPENIIEKMVQGRLRNFFAERVLTEQPFVMDETTTVDQVLKSGGMKVNRFVNWKLGKA